jgi:hypothetical protein
MKNLILCLLFMTSLASCTSSTKNMGRSISSDPCADHFYQDDYKQSEEQKKCQKF